MAFHANLDGSCSIGRPMLHDSPLDPLASIPSVHRCQALQMSGWNQHLNFTSKGTWSILFKKRWFEKTLIHTHHCLRPPWYPLPRWRHSAGAYGAQAKTSRFLFARFCWHQIDQNSLVSYTNSKASLKIRGNMTALLHHFLPLVAKLIILGWKRVKLKAPEIGMHSLPHVGI